MALRPYGWYLYTFLRVISLVSFESNVRPDRTAEFGPFKPSIRIRLNSQHTIINSVHHNFLKFVLILTPKIAQTKSAI